MIGNSSPKVTAHFAQDDDDTLFFNLQTHPRLISAQLRQSFTMPVYGMSANYDATAASQGVPLSDRHRGHDDIEHADGTFVDANSASPAETLDNEKDEAAAAESELVRRQSVVQALARSYSKASAAAGGDENPFLAGPDSPLNPASENFSGREWAKAIAEMVSQDGGSFRKAGVCFQNMNVYGYGQSTDYQGDVANVWLSLAGNIRNLVGSNRTRIDILRQFDGLVHQGEMLVVLGPPGSGCSTFLKTIAGEMNGIYVDDGSYFNYQGMFNTRVLFLLLSACVTLRSIISFHRRFSFLFKMGLSLCFTASPKEASFFAGLSWTICDTNQCREMPNANNRRKNNNNNRS